MADCKMGRKGFGVGVVSVVTGVPCAGVVAMEGSTDEVAIKDLMFKAGRPRMIHHVRAIQI